MSIGIDTKTGCRIAALPWPNEENDGSKILSLRMLQSGDGREASVILTTEERRAVALELAPELAHDMPAELYNEVTDLLMAYAAVNIQALYAVNKLSSRYGRGVRKTLGLD